MWWPEFDSWWLWTIKSSKDWSIILTSQIAHVIRTPEVFLSLGHFLVQTYTCLGIYIPWEANRQDTHQWFWLCWLKRQLWKIWEEKTEFKRLFVREVPFWFFILIRKHIVTCLKKIRLEADIHTLIHNISRLNEEMFRLCFKVFTQPEKHIKSWKEKSHVGGFKTRKYLRAFSSSHVSTIW